MKIRDKAGNVLNAIITYESIAASYMRPAFIVDGRAYSPAEAKEAGLIAVSVRHGEWTKLKQGGYDLPDETPEAVAGRKRKHSIAVTFTKFMVHGAAIAIQAPFTIDDLVGKGFPPSREIITEALDALVAEGKLVSHGNGAYQINPARRPKLEGFEDDPPQHR